MLLKILKGVALTTAIISSMLITGSYCDPKPVNPINANVFAIDNNSITFICDSSNKKYAGNLYAYEMNVDDINSWKESDAVIIYLDNRNTLSVEDDEIVALKRR